jgi:hypothetical protein
VQAAVALIADADWGMRALMRRAVQTAGFVVLEGASNAQLEVALQNPMIVTAPRALMVVSATLMAGAGRVLATLVQQRTSSRQVLPYLILTCEFGALGETPELDFGGCISAGILEKPFDFALLQGLAYRCRTFPVGVQPLVVNGR